MKNYIAFLMIIFSSVHLSCDGEKKLNYIGNTNKEDCSRKVSYGDIDICLPKIEGMTECYEHPIVNERANAYEYKHNTVLGFYLSNDVYSNVEQLNDFHFDDYFKIYAFKQVNSRSAGKVELNRLSSLMERNEFKVDWDRMVKDLDSITSSVKVDRPVLIENYSPHDDVRTFIMLSKYRSSESERVLCMTFNIMLIKNKIIYLSYYRDYFDKSCIVKTKSKNDYIVLRVVDEN